MRRLFVLTFLAVAGLCNTGCLLNQYSPDPTIRTEQLVFQSEDLRQIGREWRIFWMNDQPSHLTPEHLHGGIGP
jgi:hypothetical protein